MHRFRSGIVGVTLVGVLAGCGGTTVDEGPKPFQSTDIKGVNMEPMLKEMQESMKKGTYTKKAVPSEKAKEAEKKK